MKNISHLQIVFKPGYIHAEDRLLTIIVSGDGEQHTIQLPISVFHNDFESSFDWMMREAANIIKQKCRITNASPAASIALSQESKV